MRLLRVVYWLVVLVIVSLSDFQFAAVSIFLWLSCFSLALLYVKEQEISPSHVDFKGWDETDSGSIVVSVQSMNDCITLSSQPQAQPLTKPPRR
jgi:hypothetical protein